MTSQIPDPGASRGHQLKGSIIVPAHDEARVIGRTLRGLAPLVDRGVELIVVANGCSDDTARQARAAAPRATVIESPIGSKTHAIRLGEAAARQLPRLYVDADIRLSENAAAATLAALDDGAIAARPSITYDSRGATWPVQRYYRARRQMPSLFRHAWGAGVYGLSAAARARFGEFPDVIGDDLWIDSLLAPGELVVVDTDPVIVTTPKNSRSLLALLRRKERAEREPAAPMDRERDSTLRDLAEVLRSGPAGLVDGLAYASYAVAARVPTKRNSTRWERDMSSRT